MPLLARCPHCRHEFPIAPRFRDSDIACVACGERFLFTDGPELPDAGEEYVVEAPAEEDREPEVDVELVPAKRGRSGFGKAVRLTLFCVLPALVAGGGVVYLWHRLHVQPAHSDTPESYASGFPVVDPLEGFPPDRVLELHVSDASDALIQEAVMEGADSLVDPGGQRRTSARSAGGRTTILVAPVSDPQAAANAIKFGEVQEVRGRVITLRANPFPGLPPGADAVDRALFALQNRNPVGRFGGAHGRREAIETLAKSPADHRRKAVAAVLVDALGDHDLAFFGGDEILAALCVWGTEDCVPAIEKYMWDTRLNAFGHNGLALKALAKIKGKRALAVVMRAFDEGHGFDRRFEFGDPMLGESYDIKKAIIAFGPEAEDEVLARFQPKNVALYGMICNILKEIGAEKSIPVLEELAAKSPAVRSYAEAAVQSIESRKK